MPDTHFGEPKVSQNGGHDEGAFRTALKAIEVIRPDEFIHIGDIGEWDSCSPWQFKRRQRPPLQITLDRLNQDLTLVNREFDRICEVLDEVGCEKRTLIEGNHEIWVKEMCSEMDLVREHYAMEKVLRLEERGFDWAPYGQYVKRGKIRLYHGGHYTTVHHAFAHATKCGASMGYGHTHDVQYVTVPSVEGPHLGVSFGCLCDLDKAFLRGRLTNWQHAFGIIYLQENGEFNVDVRRIEAGWVAVNGREIRDGKLLAGRPRKETT